MGSKKTLAYILLTDAKGWTLRYPRQDNVETVLWSFVPRGSILLLRYEPNHPNPTIAVADQPGYQVAGSLLSHMRKVTKENLALLLALRPAKYETRYQLIDDGGECQEWEEWDEEWQHFQNNLSRKMVELTNERKNLYSVFCHELEEIKNQLENVETQMSKNASRKEEIKVTYAEKRLTLLHEESNTKEKRKVISSKCKIIDAEIKELQEKRCQLICEDDNLKTELAKIVKDKGSIQNSLKKESKAKDDEKQSLNKNLKDLTQEKAMKEKEIEKVLNCDDISSANKKEGGKEHPFLEFLTTTIDKMEKDLECPVCLEVATIPIFQCPDSHLVCSTCLPKIKACPECRVRYIRPVKRHRFAEKALVELQSFYAKRNDILQNF